MNRLRYSIRYEASNTDGEDGKYQTDKINNQYCAAIVGVVREPGRPLVSRIPGRGERFVVYVMPVFAKGR
jgi:hypothetical protein